MTSTITNLKIAVDAANKELVRRGLVLLTWGNASAIDREHGLVVIKPSGVPYETMTPEDMVVVDLDGNVIESRYKPSSDTATHLVLYRAFSEIGGVVHTHSGAATAWAQSQRAIPPLGTTHADYFAGEIPCTRSMTPAEIGGEYEKETGNVIVECFAQKKLDPLHVPAVLVAHHGPFTWGRDVNAAVENAIVLEEVARIAATTVSLNPAFTTNPVLIEKHFNRKHGATAYYGQ
ncbi:MAG: L-ribulose-5-phosphate 4-epimerase [Thermoguttaceae bacterium]